MCAIPRYYIDKYKNIYNLDIIWSYILAAPVRAKTSRALRRPPYRYNKGNITRTMRARVVYKRISNKKRSFRCATTPFIHSFAGHMYVKLHATKYIICKCMVHASVKVKKDDEKQIKRKRMKERERESETKWNIVGESDQRPQTR